MITVIQTAGLAFCMFGLAGVLIMAYLEHRERTNLRRQASTGSSQSRRRRRRETSDRRLAS